MFYLHVHTCTSSVCAFNLLSSLFYLQLLNSLFGLNVAMQQTHVYSPFLCSLPYTLKAPPTTTPTE